MVMSKKARTTSSQTKPQHKRLALRDRLPQAFSFAQADKIIILCLAVIFIGLFIYLLRVGDQPYFAYLTFCALLTMLFVGFLRATGIISTSWIAIGGSAAVYVALWYFPKDEFWKYQTRQERQTITELTKENEGLKSQISSADPAKNALYAYFTALQNRRYEEAYALVSEARKQEREHEFGRDHFAQYRSAFANTTGYDNIVIAASQDRKYKASYDVTDSVPRNELYGLQKQLLSSFMASKLLNRDAIEQVIIENLQGYYIVRDEATIEAIKSYIKTQNVEDVFSPIFFATLERSLHEHFKINLERNAQSPEKANITQHYMHEIIMVQENGAWKIRKGLNNPVIAVLR